MKYMGDSTWWNERFKSRNLNLMKHEKYLEKDIGYFTDKNKILDVACGDGRNAIYLACMKHQVSCLDFSEEALKRLNYFAGKEGLDITTKLVDLSEGAILELTEKYDAIIMNHYRLNPQLYSQLMSALNQGGILWVNGFREVPLDNPNITESDILKEDDFRFIRSYTLVDRNEYDEGQRKFVRYIWKK